MRKRGGKHASVGATGESPGSSPFPELWAPLDFDGSGRRPCRSHTWQCYQAQKLTTEYRHVRFGEEAGYPKT
jgi:hypothetical protein